MDITRKPNMQETPGQEEQHASGIDSPDNLILSLCASLSAVDIQVGPVLVDDIIAILRDHRFDLSLFRHLVGKAKDCRQICESSSSQVLADFGFSAQ